MAFSEKLKKKKVRENDLGLKSKLMIHLFGGIEMLVKCILNLEKFRNNFWTQKLFFERCGNSCENMKIISLFVK